MTVDHLTAQSLDFEECVKLSESTGANHAAGTDMRILGPIIAERSGLKLTTSSNSDEMIAHLQSGGETIAHVGNKGDGMPGLFSAIGHYITLISYSNGEVCILDPSYKEDKFDTDDRKEKVCVEAPFVYCSVDTLLGELGGLGLYMFKRKTDR